MLFSSTVFLWLFLPAVVLLNFFIKTKYSNYLLLVASLLFYAWGEPIYVLLMLFSIFLNWGFGLWIHRAKKGKRQLLALCVLINLALLGYYKYYNFFAESVNGIFGSEWIPVRNIMLPIGISFFTFQALSYVVDLYRGDCRVQKNPLCLALYVSFFPQLIAGPIVRYSDVENQIQNRTVSVEGFSVGLRRFLYGLGKKVIISNCMAEVVDRIFALSSLELSFSSAWFGAIAYMMQIYYDFSGYSDMAIGLGKMFGFDFLENFNYPYLSGSIQEFWQRWHISLGTWFREYVYIPLGGNRKGKGKTYRNLIVVFFLTGLWHGANWTFILWGLYHGFFQIIERLGLKKILQKHTLISRIYCLLVVLFGWVLFRAESIGRAVQYVGKMILPSRGILQFPEELTLRVGVFLILALLGSGFLQSLQNKIPKLSRWKNSYAELGFLCFVFAYGMILLASGTYNPFIYFRF